MIRQGESTVGAALEDLMARLADQSDSAGLDAQQVLARVIDQPRSWVLAHLDAPLTSSRAAALERLANRLEKGEPLPYVLGRWEFFGLEFEITPDVLIPRPETELLVERAIGWLQARPERHRAADIGTGSGCIGIALAASIPDLQVMGSDLSPAALKIAQRNAAKNGVEQRMEFVCCNLLPAEAAYDLIVANLPYIPTQTLHELSIYGREPTLALDGGADGLQLIRNLVNMAPERLLPGGLLLMEIESSEGPAALSLAYDAFSEAKIRLHKDLTGRDRLLEIQI